MDKTRDIDERLDAAIEQLFEAVARDRTASSRFVTDFDIARQIALIGAVYVERSYRQKEGRPFHDADLPDGYTVVVMYGDICKKVDINEYPLPLNEARILARDIASQHRNLSEILAAPFIAVDRRIASPPYKWHFKDNNTDYAVLPVGLNLITIACNTSQEANILSKEMNRGFKGRRHAPPIAELFPRPQPAGV